MAVLGFFTDKISLFSTFIKSTSILNSPLSDSTLVEQVSRHSTLLLRSMSTCLVVMSKDFMPRTITNFADAYELPCSRIN